jgi:predicted O-methyltransferase YrrM
MNIVKGRRWDYFPKLFEENGYTIGAEIGVELGRFSKCLLQKVPNLTLYSIDPWESYANQNSPKKFYEYAKTRLEPFDKCHMIRDYSMDAVQEFDDDFLDFVYIDANHDYEHTKEDIREWHNKVKKDGIVAGHDYSDDGDRYGVKKAVDEWVEFIGAELNLLKEKKGYPCWWYKK